METVLAIIIGSVVTGILFLFMYKFEWAFITLCAVAAFLILSWAVGAIILKVFFNIDVGLFKEI